MFLLASNSPRRKELLALTGLPFSTQPADIDESVLPAENPLDYVKRVSEAKAGKLSAESNKDVILAADTIVVDGTEILGKPATKDDARRMLIQLRGRVHFVHTSIVIVKPGEGRMERDLCSSRVEMRQYSNDEIQEYIDSGDPMDKAGAYAVQNRDFSPVVHFGGCFANVMGLPLCHLQRTLAKFSISPVKNVPTECQHYLMYDCPIHAKVLAGEQIG